MCIATGNSTCDAMAKLHLQGNIIPKIWHKTIVSEKTGKADLIAINILADIAYWYRPAEERDELTGAVIGCRPKFAADLLQRSYDDLADHFGISKGQAKSAIVRLEQLGVIRRIFRKVSVGGVLIPNVLFLELNVERLCELTYPDDNGTSIEKTEEDTILSNGGMLKKRTPLSILVLPLCPQIYRQIQRIQQRVQPLLLQRSLSHSRERQTERVILCPQREFRIILTYTMSFPQAGWSIFTR